MRETEFAAWLEAQQYAANTVSTKMSEARRLDQQYGDLDDHYAQNQLETLLRTFRYTRADEAAGRANPTSVAIDGNLYNALSSYRSAITLYRRFLEAGDQAQGRLSGLDREAIFAGMAACDAAGSPDAFVADLKDRGLPNRYWLVHAGKRYPSKAIVHWAMRERGLDASAGGSLCKAALEELGFVVIDWPELQRCRDSFLRQMSNFTSFIDKEGEYWEVERRYKNQLIEDAHTIAASANDDRAAGEKLYRILVGGQQGVPLNWRTLPEVQAADPALTNRFYNVLGELARSEAPAVEAIAMAAGELEALRDAGIAGLRRGEVLSIPITVWATLHPDEASWFKIAKIEETGKRIFGRKLFPQNEFRESDLAEWLQLMRALFGLLDNEFGWEPQDLFDVQGFIWVALGGNEDSEPPEADTAELNAVRLDLSEAARPYWFVGASFGRTDSQVDRFLAEGIWQIDTPTLHQRQQVEAMQPGDRIAIKATFVQQHDLPFDGWGRKVSVMRIKARGTITAPTTDGETVQVEWDEEFEPRDWYFYTYQPTIWRVGTGKEMSRRLIRFTFDDEEQDIEWFRANLSRWSDGPDAQEGDKETASQSDPINLILYGPPGTGKTYRTMGAAVKLCEGLDDEDPLLTEADLRRELRDRYDDLVALGRIALVTFHQNFSYEEFVEGLRPHPLDGGGFTLQPKSGIFRDMAEAARDSAEEHVLIVDEINRANISKVFGELITLIEPDKRLGKSESLRVTLPYSNEQFGVPANLHIIGTMNTADRSIALLDTALRRRFRFEEIAPQPGLLPERVDGVPLRRVLEVMNERIEYLHDREHRIGHAFFMGDGGTDREAIDATMRDKVIPLLQEYFFDDWSRLAAVVGEGFIEKRKLPVPPGIESGEDRLSWSVRSEFAGDVYDTLIGKAPLRPERSAE